MNTLRVLVAVLAGSLVSGCAALDLGPSLPDQPRMAVIFQPSDADMILTCLAEREDWTRNEMREEYAFIAEQVGGGTNGDILDMICLSLHRHASYQQFKDGMESLAARIEAYPEQAAGLQGVLVLSQRIDREKISRWSLANKNNDEKEGLEAENRELLERIEVLQANATLDQARIGELQKQIEQLKNIENIIKSRER